jgi:Ser/Thr protein kinase RdoA (MazF antagonist)
VEGPSASGDRGEVGRLRRLAAVALSAYPVQPTALVLLGHSENVTFRVDTGTEERFVLRIHRAGGSPFHPVRNVAEVRSEMDWLVALRRDIGPRVPEPVPAGDDSLVTVADVAGMAEPRICVLLRWVPGEFRSASLTAANLASVGELMAHLHDQVSRFTPLTGFTRGRIGDVAPDVAADVVSTLAEVGGPEASSLVAGVFDRIRRAEQAIGETPSTFGLIHADLHQGNYLFTDGEVCAIDFDDCGWGHFIYDFAVTLSEVSVLNHFPALRDGLLAGYQQVRPLPAGLEVHLPAFLALRELKLMIWLLEQRDRPGFADALDVPDSLQYLRDLVEPRRSPRQWW